MLVLYTRKSRAPKISRGAKLRRKERARRSSNDCELCVDFEGSSSDSEAAEAESGLEACQLPGRDGSQSMDALQQRLSALVCSPQRQLHAAGAEEGTRVERTMVQDLASSKGSSRSASKIVLSDGDEMDSGHFAPTQRQHPARTSDTPCFPRPRYGAGREAAAFRISERCRSPTGRGRPAPATHPGPQ